MYRPKIQRCKKLHTTGGFWQGKKEKSSAEESWHCEHRWLQEIRSALSHLFTFDEPLRHIQLFSL